MEKSSAKGKSFRPDLCPKIVEIDLNKIVAIGECTGSGEDSEAALLRKRFEDSTDPIGAAFPHIKNPA